MKARRCLSIARCDAAPGSAPFCAGHMAMMQTDTRRVLDRVWKPNARATFVSERTIETAQREILYFETEGHRVPRDQPFEFDDNGKDLRHAG